MADAEPLRRLGGGRWQTKDGRFLIEPQSGTWMVVDSEQTDDLGLALVRGPFRSLTAARDAIGQAREQGVTISPLAEIVETARSRSSTRSPSVKRPTRRAAPHGRQKPDEPDEPTWLAKLDETQRRRARTLIRRLEQAGVADATAIVHAELVEDRPALARLAVGRRLRALIEATGDDAASVARAVAQVLVSGDDAVLGVGWRLTDATGRPIQTLDMTGEGE